MSWELEDYEVLDDDTYKHCCYCDGVEHDLAEPVHDDWYCSKQCYGFAHG